ncbi:hypothetical protein O3P69_012149 [Scylla paramamosain]|uniref:Tyrosine-protein kinase receptor n=1 Tax=Scylla paramamosain TaxID=85552 RepID=A0AAW0TBX1_SCYPA
MNERKEEEKEEEEEEETSTSSQTSPPNTTYTPQPDGEQPGGEGPAEATTITTHPNAPAVDDGQGYLLLTSGSSLLKLGLDTIDPLQHIYNTSRRHQIMGMAIHIRLGIVYISDSSGSILQLHPTTNRFRILLSANHLHGHPLGLSVDWLNGHLYYIIRHGQVWQVWRCGLMGSSPQPVHGELQYEAKHLQVDPFNGYIWWISEDLEPGLHRLDLRSDRAGAGSGGEEGGSGGGDGGLGGGRGPEVVLESSDLGGLVLDPPNFQVLVADRRKNAILAVSLDGTSVTRLHPNTQQAFFRNLSSVVYLHRRFFWTDGKEVLTEELNNGTFYHNSYLLVGNVSIGTLVAVHKSTQPVPVPLNPPTHLQAVFTRRSATLTWNTPVLPALMGSGAWQDWRYELHIRDGRRTIYKNNITTTEYLVASLLPATFYVIKVRAYSQDGYGPWSAEFRGSTLDNTPDAPRLVLATDTQLLMTNLAGSDSKVAVSQARLMAELKGGRISDLAFYRDALVLAVTNQSSILVNTTSGTFRRLAGTKGVLSLAVDWVVHRLFWANPHKQMIGWSGMEDAAHGPFNVVTAAREVRVDALHGRLYWTTSHALLSSTLAGRNISTLHREGIFSGKQVYGLTVDAGGGRVWWVVRDVEGCHLYSATLSAPFHPPHLTGTPKLLPHSVQVGSMWYLSERLVWLEEDGDTVVADISLNNSASLHTASLKVSKFTVVLAALHPAPEGVTAPGVLPGRIETEGVKVLGGGDWDNFTITWPAITTITHGDLVYEVVVGEAKTPIITTNTSLSYTNASLPPYSPLRVSVRGVTNWGVGPRVVTELRTPPALPGAPQDLRTFIMRPVKDSPPTICLRWSAPTHPNGALTGYTVAFWVGQEAANGSSREVWVPAAPTQFLLHDLDPSTVYTFRVSAINTVGEGPASTAVSTQPQHHSPLPLLLVVRANQSRATSLDADLGVEETLVSGGALGVRFVAPLLPHYIKAIPSGASNAYASALSAELPSLLSSSSLKQPDRVSSSSSSSPLSSKTSKFPSVSSPSSTPTENHDSPSVTTSNTSAPSVSISTQSVIHSTSPSTSSTSLLAWMDINSDIFLTHTHTNATERVLRLVGEGVGLALDWVGEVVVWGEKRPPSPNMTLHSLTLWRKGGGGRKIREVVVQGKVVGFLLSSMTSQVFVVHSVGQRLQLSVMGLKDGKELENVFDQKRSQKCNCRRNPNLTGAVALDSTNTTSLHLYFSASSSTSTSTSSSGWSASTSTSSSTTLVYRSDLEGCVCEAVFNPRLYGLDSCTHLAVDSTHLYCHSATSRMLAWVAKGASHSGPAHTLPLGEVSAILPLDPATQPLPAASCLVMRNYTRPPKLVGSSETAIGLELSPPLPLTPDCGPVSLPPPTFVLYYSPEPDVEGKESRGCAVDATKCWVKRTADPIMKVEDLQPYTHYVFRAAVETVYNQRLGLPSHPGPPMVCRTKAKAPEGVGEVTTEALSPEEVRVSFQAAAGEDYEVHWRGGGSTAGPLRPPPPPTSQRLLVTIPHLSPNTKYEVWVKVFSKDGLVDVDSEHVEVMTLPPLPALTLRHPYARSLLVAWTSPADNSVNRHRFQYLPEGKSRWRSLDTEMTSPDHTYLANLTQLLPATHYLFRIQVVYTKTLHNYSWPSEPLFNYSTLSEIPGAPGQVMRQVGRLPLGSGLKVWWKQAKANGAPIIAYTLQAAPYHPNQPPTADHTIGGLNTTFTTVYNGSDNEWMIQGLDDTSSYIFRVRAVNRLGQGEWGEENIISTVAGPTMLNRTHLPTILYSTIPTIAALVLMLCLSGGLAMRRTEKKKRKAKAASISDSSLHHPHHHHPRGREVELANLGHLPTSTNFVTENNVLYDMTSFPGDDLDLPHVSRQCITLTKFLGSGAFGEVFEGTACVLPGRPDVTKVAIKTLRKGATEGEKVEFLKEAQLMSHFQHEHILRLLAVCTDHDPFFLILELMEGGDLLSYLRTSRGSDVGLTLGDLVDMCLDVAKGCVYLEEMHYVHRDLAARNCLVSTTDPQSRIVKIGDFGLARDIYKNDYYRKEGEGLLPVRWMSPESLIDGVFTSHSDVWAFGVLLWEILTLGQQPYPARTNLEVLHHVRSGGTLTRPPGCPEELHKLMERCWSYSPERRPTFKECLGVLLLLAEAISALPALAVHNVHYIGSSGNSGISEEDCLPETSALGRRRRRRRRRSSLEEEGDTVNMEEEEEEEEEESDSFSGASTLPLTAPLRRNQQYLQLVNEPSPASPPLSPRAPSPQAPATLPRSTLSDWGRLGGQVNGDQ